MYAFESIKDKKDLFTRVLIVLIGIPLIYWLIHWQQQELNQPISNYEIIYGSLVDKGTEKDRYDEKYFIRVKNNSGIYKVEIAKNITPKYFLKKLKKGTNITAWVTRTLGNIELVQLKSGNKYIIKHTTDKQ